MNRLRAIRGLLRALKPLQSLHSSIPLPCALTFLLVALDEGKTSSAYARDLGISRTTMFRYLRFIGERSRSGSPGLGLLIVEPHPTRLHNTQVRLTAKGRSISNTMFERLRQSR